MKEKIKRLFCVALACLTLSCILPMGAGCGTQTGGDDSSGKETQPVVIPADYKAEVDDVMFYEDGDYLKDGKVVQNMDLHIYNYAPSILQADENTRYAYYCSNRPNNGYDKPDELGNHLITDYVAFRKGLKSQEGDWYWSPKQYVLGPIKENGVSASATEGEQVCDPNVIRGQFKYKADGKEAHTYSYLMAYLACNTRDNTYNHVCLAVADKPEGPWIRCENINPFIEYEQSRDPAWGYGQASMISVDKKGRVLMFYSAICYSDNRGQTEPRSLYATNVIRYDMSDLNNVKEEFYVEIMPVTGIKRLNSQVSTITGADYAYDPATNRFYGAFDGVSVGRNTYSGAPLAWVENKSAANNAEIGDVFKDYSEADWKANGISWNTIYSGKANDKVNYKHAHNVAVIRDEYGHIPDKNNVEMAITGALTPAAYHTMYPDDPN